MVKVSTKAELLLLAFSGDLETIQKAPKEEIPEDAILVAALHNQAHVVTYLCLIGCDEWATAAISMACHANGTKALKALLDLKVRPDPVAMSNAIRQGWPECMKLLAGYNLPILPEDICRAAKMGFYDVVELANELQNARSLESLRFRPHRVRALPPKAGRRSPRE